MSTLLFFNYKNYIFAGFHTESNFLYIKMKSSHEIKNYLEKRLIEENSFWSFDISSCQNLSDWNLIKYVLIRLDLDDIKHLFQLYPKGMIKQVWLQELVTQGDYLMAMNICFALVFFNAKKPRQYVKAMETRMLKKKL